MARKWTPWPRAELDRLERLLKAGHTYAQIGEAMGRGQLEVQGAAQRIGLMSPERRAWRKRQDWPVIDRMLTDCIEAQLMTVPQAQRQLAAKGITVSTTSLYNRLADLPRHVRIRAKKNSQNRKAATCARMRQRQEIKRRKSA